MPFLSIAIDGPAGAGKSTLARSLAEQIRFLYVDTGAIYRTVGLYVANQGNDPSLPEQGIPLLPEISIRGSHDTDGLQHM